MLEKAFLFLMGLILSFLLLIFSFSESISLLKFAINVTPYFLIGLAVSLLLIGANGIKINLIKGKE